MKVLLTSSGGTNEDISTRIKKITVNNHCQDMLSHSFIDLVDYDKRMFSALKRGDEFKIYLATNDDDSKLIYENTGTRSDDLQISDTYYGCQTFYAKKPEYLKSVSLRVKGTSTDTQTVYIKLYAVDTNHKPTGSVLATGSASVGFTSTATFNKIDFTTEYLLTSGTEYAIVFYTGETHPSANDNSVEYSKVENRRGWIGGWYVSSGDAGSSWTVIEDRCFAFKIHLGEHKCVFAGTFDNSNNNPKNAGSNIPSGVITIPTVSHGYRLNDKNLILNFDNWLGHWALKNIIHETSDISSITLDANTEIGIIPFKAFSFDKSNIWGASSGTIYKVSHYTFETVSSYSPAQSIDHIFFDGNYLITTNIVNNRLDFRLTSTPATSTENYLFPEIIDGTSSYAYVVAVGRYYYILSQLNKATPFDGEWAIVKCHKEGASGSYLVYDDYYRLDSVNMRDNTVRGFTFDGRYFYVLGGADGSRKVAYYDLLKGHVDPYTKILTKVGDFTPNYGNNAIGINYYWDEHNEYIVEMNNSGLYAKFNIINRMNIKSTGIEITNNKVSYTSRGETGFGALKSVAQALGMNYYVDEGQNVVCATASDSLGNIEAYNGTQDNAENNVLSWDISKIEVVNKVTVYGRKMGNSQIMASYQDDTSIAKYGTIEKEIRSENIYNYEEAYDMAKAMIELQKDGIVKGKIEINGESGVEMNKKIQTNISNGATYVQDTFMKFDAQATDGWTNVTNTSGHTDNSDSKQGDYSLQFSLAASQTYAAITNTNITTTNISNYKKASFWFYVGTSKRVSKITLLIGNDVNNYIECYIYRIKSGWNYAEVDLKNYDSSYGTPDLTNIGVVRFIFTYTSGDAVTIRLDDLRWLDCRYDVVGITHLYGAGRKKYKTQVVINEKPRFISDSISNIQGRASGAVSLDNPYKFKDGSYLWSAERGNTLTLTNCVQEDDGITISDVNETATAITETKALGFNVTYGLCNLIGKDLGSSKIEISNDGGSTYDEAIIGRPEPFTASNDDIKVRVSIYNDIMMLLTWKSDTGDAYYSKRWFDRYIFPQIEQKTYIRSYVLNTPYLKGCYDTERDVLWITEGTATDSVVRQIDPKTYKEISKFDVNDLYLEGVVYDGTYLWVAGLDISINPIMRKYSTAGVQQGGDITTEDSPYGLAYDGTNIWYTYSNYIAKINQTQALSDGSCTNASGNEISRFQDTDFSGFTDLTFDRDGNIWAIGSNYSSGKWSEYQIVRYTTSGTKVYGVSKPFLNTYPMSIIYMKGTALINPKLQGIELKLRK